MAIIRLSQIQDIIITESELNSLSGITVSAAELNVLDGFTGTTLDLNNLIGLEALFAAHEAADYPLAHDIPAGSLDGLAITDGTIVQAKLAFGVALPADITGLQIQVDDVVSDTAVQQGQIDNLYSIVIPGQGNDLADAIQQVIDHIELPTDAHDSSAISYGNYYTLPSDITGGVTTSLVLPASLIKHFRVGESVRFQDDVTLAEDVVLTAVDYNTYTITFLAPTSGFTTLDNGIIWTLAEDQVQEALDRSLRNNTDVMTGRLTIIQNSTDHTLVLNQAGAGDELHFTTGVIGSDAGYDFEIETGHTFSVNHDANGERFLVDDAGDGYLTQLKLREEGTAFHGTLTKQTLTADRTWTLPDRDALVGMPVISLGDGLKVLRVNAGETDVEWHDVFAVDIDFDNTDTGLAATDVQEAIDEHVLNTSIHFDSIDGLSDVDTTTVAPLVDELLVWDGTNWVPSPPVRSSLIKTTFHDPLTTTLPTGVSVVIDNVSGANGDLVLFSNLTIGANKIYELSGVGVAIAWTATTAFAGLEDPELSHSVIIEKGDAFAQRIGTFDGTNWEFNNTVRYFNGADFWEATSLKSSSLINSTTADVFTTNATGSENVIVDYSISRGANKETGTLVITHDGTSANTGATSSSLGSVGVSLFSDILAGQLRLRYAADASGPNGVIKFSIKRWSDGAGGPTGVPNYTGAGSGSAGGSVTEVQYHGAGGVLDGDPNFTWDDANGVLSLKGLNINGQSGPITLLDNTTTVEPAMTRDATTFKSMFVDYSIERGSDIRTGTMIITNNYSQGGTAVGFSDQFAETAGTGIILTAAIDGSNIVISYSSSSTGTNANFKYTVRYWN